MATCPQCYVDRHNSHVAALLELAENASKAVGELLLLHPSIVRFFGGAAIHLAELLNYAMCANGLWFIDITHGGLAKIKHARTCLRALSVLAV